MNTAPAHNNNFDFLRFLFASFVILTHSYILMGDITHDPIFPYTGRVLSELAVCGFFVISGYLIQQSLERSRSSFSFLKKRVLRIFPGLVVAVLFTVLLLGPLVSTLSPSGYFRDGGTWRYLLKNMILLPEPYLPGVFTHNTEPAVNGSLWTLRYEVLFYLLLSALFPFSFTRKRLIIPSLLLICLVGYFSVKYNLVSLQGKPLSFCTYLFILGIYFAGGATLSLYRQQLQQYKTPALLLSAVLFLLSLLTGYAALEPLGMLSFVVMVISFGLHYFPLLHFSRYTGDVSYGTYIYAFPLQQALIVWLQPQQGLALMIPSFLLSWLMGWLSWHLVEKRFLRPRSKPPVQ